MERAEQLAQQQRVAGRCLQAGGGEGRGGIGSQRQGHEPADRRGAERRGPDRARRGAGELVEQLELGPRLEGPLRDREHDREIGDPVGEVGKEAQRRRVGPVRIVDHEHERAVRGQVDGQPVQPVERGVEALAARAQLGGVERLEQRRGEAGGSGQRPLSLLGREPREQRLEELADHTEGEIALELATAGAGRGVAEPAGDGERLAQQAALADARRALDHGNATGVDGRALDRLA
jgi:hypothetical protein